MLLRAHEAPEMAQGPYRWGLERRLGIRRPGSCEAGTALTTAAAQPVAASVTVLEVRE